MLTTNPTPMMQLHAHLQDLGCRRVADGSCGRVGIVMYLAPGGKPIIVQVFDNGGFDCYIPLLDSLSIAENLAAVTTYVQGK